MDKNIKLVKKRLHYTMIKWNLFQECKVVLMYKNQSIQYNIVIEQRANNE